MEKRPAEFTVTDDQVEQLARIRTGTDHLRIITLTTGELIGLTLLARLDPVLQERVRQRELEIQDQQRWFHDVIIPFVERTQGGRFSADADY
jgi:hypothetical protein